MKLLPDELLIRLIAQDLWHDEGPGHEPNKGTDLVLARWYVDGLKWSWYAASACRNEESDEVKFFGFKDAMHPFLGYFWFSEMLIARDKVGMRVKLDCDWQPISLQQVMENAGDPEEILNNFTY